MTGPSSPIGSYSFAMSEYWDRFVGGPVLKRISCSLVRNLSLLGCQVNPNVRVVFWSLKNASCSLSAFGTDFSRSGWLDAHLCRSNPADFIIATNSFCSANASSSVSAPLNKSSMYTSSVPAPSMLVRERTGTGHGKRGPAKRTDRNGSNKKERAD
uniref:(northern house mosquito) hypothetical protein n=1 Tax=Culex pipiens TaxID=7175 RepID=A0A8D8ATZ6_CULPI